MHRITLVLSAALLLPVAPATAAEPAPRPSALDRLKALAGEWESKDEKGTVLTRTTYEVVAAGNSVLETMTFPDGRSMLTVYHRDGDRLMLTHFCMAGNQPRLVAKDAGPDARQLQFTYLDATNLRSADESHLSGVVFAFQDDSHFKEDLTFSAGSTHTPMSVSYTRLK